MGQGKSGVWFMATQWSVVLRARDGNFHESAEALQSLCHSYSAPVYSYIRYHERLSHEDCEDLVQEFLSHFVHKEWVKHLTYEKSFRSFLLTFLKRFLADARDRRNALKRGGNFDFVPLTTPDAPEWSICYQSNNLGPDEAYDRKWAETIFREAARKLEEDYVRRGRGALYAQIKDILPGKHGEKNYAGVGAQLGMSEQAIKNAVLRYRDRRWKFLCAEIAPTLDDSSEAQAELYYLAGLLAR